MVSCLTKTKTDLQMRSVFSYHLLQYHHQISGIGSEQEKSLYSSCFFTDEKRQCTDEGDQQAGGKVKGDGGRCHREGFSGGQRAKRENQGQVQNVGADDISCRQVMLLLPDSGQSGYQFRNGRAYGYHGDADDSFRDTQQLSQGCASKYHKAGAYKDSGCTKEEAQHISDDVSS